MIASIRLICAAFAATALLAAAIAGCAGGTALPRVATGGGGGGANCVVAVSPASTETIGVNLTNQSACTDPTYMAVKGYFGGGTVTSSQVVTLTSSSTNVVEFVNLDAQPHTATSLGPWTGSYPGPGPALGTPSPANTDISATGFSTGNLNGGQTSKKYLADVPGMYIIGCAYHYNSDNMRTVIIVQ